MAHKNNDVIVQSNDLVEARHTTTPLSAKEQKLILLTISRLKKEDDSFNIMEFSVSEIHELLGLKGRAEYTRTKKMLKELLSKTIEIPFENGDYLLANWFSAIRYRHNEGVFEIEFSSMLKPYLLQLKNSFTLYKLENILALNSTYSIRLYELLKKWSRAIEVEYPLDKLKEKLGIKPSQYVEYSNFKMRVLKKAKVDINSRTDIEFNFKEIKRGRKVQSIKFQIKSKENREITNNYQQPKIDKLLFNKLNNLAKYELSLSGFKQVEKIAKEIYNEEEYISQLELLVKITNEKKPRNPVGFMIHIIQEKQELAEQGLDPKMNEVKTFTEALPDWFENDSKTKSEKTPEELEEIAKAREEIEKSIENLTKK